MGEAKRTQKADKEIIRGNPPCIYCGAPSDTVEHCPPKTFFIGRAWPEGYAYPACKHCNVSFRADDQALGMLVRVRTNQQYSKAALNEFGSLVKGIARNHPALVEEWGAGRGAARKRAMRDLFGREHGDKLRYEGWGAMTLGPLSAAMIQRFMVRLGRSLFFHHVGKRFRGAIFTKHVSLIQAENAEAYLRAALSIAPLIAVTVRGSKSLEQQFSYRYNVSPDHEMFYAVVRFSDQFVFQIAAMGREVARRFIEDKPDLPVEALGTATYVDDEGLFTALPSPDLVR